MVRFVSWYHSLTDNELANLPIDFLDSLKMRVRNLCELNEYGIDTVQDLARNLKYHTTRHLPNLEDARGGYVYAGGEYKNKPQPSPA